MSLWAKVSAKCPECKWLGSGRHGCGFNWTLSQCKASVWIGNFSHVLIFPGLYPKVTKLWPYKKCDWSGSLTVHGVMDHDVPATTLTPFHAHGRLFLTLLAKASFESWPFTNCVACSVSNSHGTSEKLAFVCGHILSVCTYIIYIVQEATKYVVLQLAIIDFPKNIHDGLKSTMCKWFQTTMENRVCF